MRASMTVSALVLLAVGAVTAQQQPSPPRGFSMLSSGSFGAGLGMEQYSVYALIRLPEVQKELKLSPEQKAQLEGVEKERQRALDRIEKELGEQIKQAREERNIPLYMALNEKRRDAKIPLAEDVDRALHKVLDRKQRSRVMEILTQAEGPSTFTKPEVQRQLNLSPEQIEQIKPIVAAGQRELSTAARLPSSVAPSNLFKNAGQARKITSSTEYHTAVDDARTRAVKVRAATMQKIARVLTRGQRGNYQKMVGEPFDFTATWPRPQPATAEPKATSSTEKKESSRRD